MTNQQRRRVVHGNWPTVTIFIALVPPGPVKSPLVSSTRSPSCTSPRFANAATCRGEPYLPGIDLLTRYPGA